MNEAKSIFASKTAWVNVLTLIAALLAAIMGQDIVKENPQTVSFIAAVIAVVNVVLRWMTDQAVTLMGGEIPKQRSSTGKP